MRRFFKKYSQTQGHFWCLLRYHLCQTFDKLDRRATAHPNRLKKFRYETFLSPVSNRRHTPSITRFIIIEVKRITYDECYNGLELVLGV